MLTRGVQREAISRLQPSLRQWLGSFHDPVRNVERVVGLLRDNPFIPRDVPVHGLMFDPGTGLLTPAVPDLDARPQGKR